MEGAGCRTRWCGCAAWASGAAGRCCWAATTGRAPPTSGVAGRLGIGANGAGKTTLLQVAACQLFPSEGGAEILGERLGETDVFELRPRIGLASAAVAARGPPAEKGIDLVLTASYAIVGRWK